MKISLFSKTSLLRIQNIRIRLAPRFMIPFLAFLCVNILASDLDRRHQKTTLDEKVDQISAIILPYVLDNEIDILKAIGKSEVERNAQLRSIYIHLVEINQSIAINSTPRVNLPATGQVTYQSTTNLVNQGLKVADLKIKFSLTSPTNSLVRINILALIAILAYFLIKKQINSTLIVEKRKIASLGLHLALEASSDGWWEINKSENKALVSKKLCNLLSIKHNDKHKTTVELNANWWINYFEQSYDLIKFLCLQNVSITHKEVKILPEKGKKLHHISIKRVKILGNKYIKDTIVFMLTNVSEEVANRSRIEDMAYTDNLTKLSNRVSFELELEKLSAEKNRHQYRYSLLMLDIDNFKLLNDINGHIIGDQFLREISNRLRLILRPMDFIARIGGDEFVIIARFPNSNDEDIMRRSLAIGEKVRKAISKPFLVDDLALQYNCSIGICIDKDQSDSPLSILDNADLALYDAKDKGRNKVSFFKNSMKDVVSRRASLKEMISEALNKKTIYIHYQPIFDISLKKRGQQKLQMVGYEALFRCNHINASPGQIIKTAERTGQIDQVTEAVIDAIGNDIKYNKIRLISTQKISINVSAVEILNPNFSKQLLDRLAQNNINNDQICIEVTETAFISNIELAKRNIALLRLENIQVAMDDFGTGYASIQTLRNIKFDQIKIDRSYIQGPMNDINLALIKSLIWTARAINVDLVAEGIETEEQLNTLSSLGCTLGQGFFLDQFDERNMEAKTPLDKHI